MVTLLLLRHAKSSWNDPGLADFDRPLAPRGRKAAPVMGRYLQKKLPAPDLVLCSAAARAVETWTAVRSHLPQSNAVKFLRSLYLAPPSRILATLRRVPGSAACVMVVGHNPGLENLALQLCGTGKPKALQSLQEKFPTGALAEIRFDSVSWKDIASQTGELRRCVRPRDLA